MPRMSNDNRDPETQASLETDHCLGARSAHVCVCGEWERHVVSTSLALFGAPQPCFAPQRVCLSLSHSLPMSLSANFHLRLDGNLCQLEMAICASLRDPASDCRSRAWSAGRCLEPFFSCMCGRICLVFNCCRAPEVS